MDLREAQDNVLLPAALKFFSHEYSKHALCPGYQNYWTPSQYFDLVLSLFLQLQSQIRERARNEPDNLAQFRYRFDSNLKFIGVDK